MIYLAIPSFTEPTVRNLLLKELEKRGVKAATEVSYPTAIGMMKPDALLQNGGNYIIETKLGPQTKLFDAVTQLYDYSKYIDAVGGFAVLLPEELRRPVPIEWLEHAAKDPKTKYSATAIFKDKRPSQQFSGSLSDLAEWISIHVLRPPEYVEPDTSFAINVLNDAVGYIIASTLKMGESELEDIFGGKTVFENILQYEEGKYPLNEMRKAATYLLINQILFYHVLSSNDPIAFPKIEEDYIREPSNLATYFKRALQIDYTPTFGFDVASRLPASATDVLKNVIKAIKGIGPEKIKFDLLGKIFHDLIPFEIRKAVAAFYTNNEAAELLAQLSIDDPDAKVMDLACGSGTLLVASYHRKRELLEKSGRYFGLDEHKKFLEKDLTGIDIMPFAAHLAVVHLSLQAPIYETEKIRIAVWDSTELSPDQNIPAIHKELKEAYKRPKLDLFIEGKPKFDEQAYIKKGALTQEGIGGEEIPLEKVDLVIMNPPFTRQERLPKQYKDSLSSRLKEYKKQLHGQLGLWGYFILLADRFLKKDGRIALVYPARPLNAKSALEIRKLLLKDYHIEYLITTWERSAFSESAQYREILLIAKKIKTRKIDNKYPCKIIILKTLPKNQKESYLLSYEIKKIEDDYESSKFRSTTITQRDLQNNVDNWFIYISAFNPSIVKKWSTFLAHSKDKLITFNKYLEKNKTDFVRGVETKSGYDFNFFETFIIRNVETAIKSYDKWIYEKQDDTDIVALNRYTNEEVKIPIKKVNLGIRRASGLDVFDVSDKLDYIITGLFKGIEKILSKDSLKNYKKNNKTWRKYVESRFGRFLISRRFNLSAKGTSLLAFFSEKTTTGQNLWSLKDINEEEAKILTIWFNSTPNLLQVYLKRIETEGAWMEINKGMINDFILPDLDLININQKKCLLALFEEVKKIKFPSILDQLKNNFPTRIKIDKEILKILGFEEKQADNLIDDLYPELYQEINRLKELMAG